MSAEDLEVNIKEYTITPKNKASTIHSFLPPPPKWEKDGNKTESGFIPVRHYILENITGGKAPVLKLGNSVSTCLRINDSIREGLDLRQRQGKPTWSSAKTSKTPSTTRN